jgi:hypothetical protein
MSQQEQLLKLKSDLKHFGLNPSEWTLKKMRALQIKVEHRLDKSFAFMGHATKKKNQVKWQSLKLISL